MSCGFWLDSKSNRLADYRGSRWRFDEVELLGEDLLISASPAIQTEGDN